jgi:preprotein translocase subunit SecA
MAGGRLLAVDGALARSVYPERQDKASHAADRWTRALADAVRRRLATPVRREIAALARRQRDGAGRLAALDDAAVRVALRRLATPAVHALEPAALHEALPLLAEAAARTLGLRPYPVQLFGAATLLRGRLAEMQTGEGKTLTAGLAACLAALAGVPVHVITVNDYLAGRDAATLAPLFDYLGLRVGVVVHGLDAQAKRNAYACEITYCTNKDLVFDYLRDRVTMRGRSSALQQRARALFDGQAEPPLLRGLHFAIVDEADSILIDEARTPLILAEKAGTVAHADAFATALALAAQLSAGEHFQLDPARRELHLTQAGHERVVALSAALAVAPDSPWRAAHAREHLTLQALRAHHLFLRDQHYLVDGEGKVQIIDEYTGRVLPGRNWEQGCTR